MLDSIVFVLFDLKNILIMCPWLNVTCDFSHGGLSCDVKTANNLIHGKKRTYNKIVVSASLKKEQLTCTFIFNAIFGKESLLFYM